MIGRARFGQADLPFESGPGGRFLPRIVALIVFLAGLALAGALALGGATARWEAAGGGFLTLRLPPAASAADATATTARAVAAAAGVTGVGRVTPLPEGEAARLLAPWLGAGEAPAGLPLPLLIDVEAAAGASIDRNQLEAQLARVVPGVRVEAPLDWLARIVAMGRAVQGLALGVVAVTALAAVLTVVFTTRSELAMHREVVEILHLIGAQADYIARQYQARAFRLALLGAGIGAAAAAAITGLGVWAARDLPGAFLPRLDLAPFEWAWFLVLPLAAALIARATARQTVMRQLARLP